MTIELKTIQNVKDFVEVSGKYNDSEIDVIQGRHVIDGKSILGIFSLNLLEPVKVIIDSNSENDKIAFYNNIQMWKVNDINLRSRSKNE